jgi:hypothetical protein
MRISTLLAISILISTTLSAQQKGNVLVGGMLGFSDYKSESQGTKNNQRSFFFSPSLGKFYANNKMAGVNLNYYHSKFKDSLNSNTFGAGIFMRQYKPLGKSFFVYAEEGINGYISKFNDYYSAPAAIKAKEHSLYLNFNPGLAYAISKKLQMEVALPQLVQVSYTKRKFKNTTLPEPNENNISNFGISTGFSNWSLGYLSFGIRWLIGKN